MIKTDAHHCDWPLGHIIKVHKDFDNIIRSADVFSQGKTSLKTLAQLVPLEVTDREITSGSQDKINYKENVTASPEMKMDLLTKGIKVLNMLLQDELRQDLISQDAL